MSLSKIILKNTQPVAGGVSRDVYRHPNDPRLLIKIVRHKMTDCLPWYKFHRRRYKRYKHLIVYLHDVREYIAVYASGGGGESILAPENRWLR